MRWTQFLYLALNIDTWQSWCKQWVVDFGNFIWANILGLQRNKLMQISSPGDSSKMKILSMTFKLNLWPDCFWMQNHIDHSSSSMSRRLPLVYQRFCFAVSFIDFPFRQHFCHSFYFTLLTNQFEIKTWLQLSHVTILQFVYVLQVHSCYSWKNTLGQGKQNNWRIYSFKSSEYTHHTCITSQYQSWFSVYLKKTPAFFFSLPAPHVHGMWKMYGKLLPSLNFWQG